MDAGQRDAAVAAAEASYRTQATEAKERFKTVEVPAKRAYEEAVGASADTLTAELTAIGTGNAREDERQAAREAHDARVAEAQAEYDAVIADARDVFAARDQRYQEERRLAVFNAWEAFHADHPEAIRDFEAENAAEG